MIYVKKYLRHIDDLVNKDFKPPTDHELRRLLGSLSDDEREELNADVEALFKDAMARHMNDKHYSRKAEFIKYPCNMCSETFESPGSRNEHRTRDHPAVQRGDSHINPALSDYNVASSDEIPCKEPGCKKKSPSPSDRLRHGEKEHPDSTRWYCPYPTCSCNYGRKYDLKRHFEQHPSHDLSEK